ncbi:MULTISPECIES: amidohydrolase family protein [unclassified Cupriavidus]|uniref:amidohydrolase family protein n=1 Tax=unclassified Cupriavidus TaxID=2640874 RepID=UPI0010567392|nr:MULTISPECIES: amidohydrolase family protein [unclassified Cupriavidus]MBF6989535.1 hypothetical protein [Cupriavidus sp. IK-TO18]TDF67323.1 hypothetical protein E1J61_03265 [Cupriavidus sp. L7L]
MPDRRDGARIPRVSNSSASCAPHSTAIANACDAHLHIYDPCQKLGFANTRGVAVVRPDVTDEALQALHAGGIRGIRFSLYTEAHAVVSFQMVEALANRVAELGWHLQLHWTAETRVKPDDALLYDLLARWTGTNALRQRILVDNPASLYGFGTA